MESRRFSDCKGRGSDQQKNNGADEGTFEFRLTLRHFVLDTLTRCEYLKYTKSSGSITSFDGNLVLQYSEHPPCYI